MTYPANLARFGQAWSKALGSAEPAFDSARSRERFLEAHRQQLGRAKATRWPWMVAAAAILLLVVGGMVARRGGHPSRPFSAVEPGAWIETRAGETFPLEFSEGSRVLLLGQSRVQVASVDPRGARVVLLRGTLTADIVHRPDTAWAFAAGPFTVRVTGTRLRVAWDPSREHFEVSVEQGSVQVTGPLVEGGRAVNAGQRCAVRVRASELELTPSSRPAASSELPIISVADLPAVSSAVGAVHGGRTGGGTTAWQALEQRGQYGDAIAAAEHQGLTAIYDSGTAEDLMSLARAARHAGRGELATRALLRCRERFIGDPRAATAAFLLGRSAPPAEAVRWFAAYLREQPGGPLAQEAAGRLLEAQAQAGDRAAAKEAAKQYLAGYPEGPHAALARRILGESAVP